MKSTKEIVSASINWWKSKRPMTFTENDHLDAPEVNCRSEDENQLATAVAKFIKHQREKL